MNIFKFKRKNLLWQLILGFVALIVGLITLFDDIKGLVPLFTGIYLLIQDGVELNFKQNTYRRTKSFFGLSFGKWQPLPDIDYVSVFKTTETTTVWAASASANVSSAIVKVNLFYNTNQKIEIYDTKDVDEAFTKAKQIASVLQIDVLDATSRETKWL
ncbi:hypothetical protein [Winogradskyella endarachnes]|uniref:Uncharacterized protein n=1 Tax=Winogradskyella endarachnes TaxID=2681965 RepID=A0A6L6U867_9FLAO|nr:hypothetical protein [Winogradskyella endarachnes]MUU78495.1 hypothetical protein [Winogradskyella endarachnes]